MDRKKMDGKVALVTGAGSGIGRAIAMTFIREGAKVALIDVDEKGGAETFSMIKEIHGEAFFMRVDVSKGAEVKHMVEEVIRKYEHLDYAANNAGIEGAQATIDKQPEDNWNHVIDINLKGVFLCMKYEIAAMLNRGSGAIVNTSSVAGLAGYTGMSPYVASKHGVIGLTRTVALEYADKGIRVNAVCPGVIKTPMIDRLTQRDPEIEKSYAAMEPIGRLGTPQEVAEAVVWLCSDAASFVTGYPLAVDGGFIAR